MHEGTDTHQNAQGSAAGHELTDVSTRFISGFGVGFVAMVILTGLLIWGLFRFLADLQVRKDAPAPPLAAAVPQKPPEPRLQEAPARDLGKARAEEEAVLRSYGWVDRNSGIVHIPIERAMTLLLERGLPVRKQNAKPAEAPQRKNGSE